MWLWLLLGAGALLALGGWMLRAAAARLCERAGAVAGALPILFLCIGAAMGSVAGAAIGAVAGAFTAASLLTVVIAASSAPERLRGTRSFAVLTGVAAAAMILAAFDAQIGRSEGVLLTAAAGFAGWWGFRLGEAGLAGRAVSPRGVALGVAGLLIAVGATSLAIKSVETLSVGRPDGALVVGLTALGASAAAAPVIWTLGRVRAARGQEMLREALVTIVIGLFGGAGVAALVQPLPVPESFLRVPLLVMGLDLVVVLWIAFMRRALPRGAPLVGAVVYAATLVAYLKAGG